MSNKYESNKIEKAKQLYMDFVPIAEISRQLKIKRPSLQYYVSQGWKEERKLRGTELFQELSEAKAHNFARMLKSSEKIVQNYLSHIESKEDVTPTEVKVAMQVITELDKITRLDKDSPTEIIGNQEKAVSTQDILKKLKLDPFSGVTEDSDEKFN